MPHEMVLNEFMKDLGTRYSGQQINPFEKCRELYDIDLAKFLPHHDDKVVEESEVTSSHIIDNLDPAEKPRKIIYTQSDISSFLKDLRIFGKCVKENYPVEIDKLAKLGYALYPYPGNEANVVKHLAPYVKCADILIETRHDIQLPQEL